MQAGGPQKITSFSRARILWTLKKERKWWWFPMEPLAKGTLPWGPLPRPEPAFTQHNGEIRCWDASRMSTSRIPLPMGKAALAGSTADAPLPSPVPLPALPGLNLIEMPLV